MPSEYDLAKLESKLQLIRDYAENVGERTDDGICEVEVKCIVKQTETCLEILDR